MSANVSVPQADGAFHVRRDSVLFASLTSLVMEGFGVKGRAGGDAAPEGQNEAGEEKESKMQTTETKDALQVREDQVRGELVSLFHNTLDRNEDGHVSKRELLVAAQRSEELRKYVYELEITNDKWEAPYLD